MMEKQRIIQKKWYESKLSQRAGQIVEISTHDHILCLSEKMQTAHEGGIPLNGTHRAN